ncbi:MAG: hypothetical protein FJ403_16880 [Verrucomicrobia bacterium]|nr:hypothetical protein [Verrucomicrobiota bacterium]
MSERASMKQSHWRELGQNVRKKLRRRHQGPILGLDLDGSLLRIVQLVKRGNRSVAMRLAVEPLNFANEADRSDAALVGKAIAAALDRLRVKCKAVVMGIPRASVVLRSLSMPEVKDVRELASMVHFQISKDLPIRLEDAVIDFHVRRALVPTAMLEPNVKASGVPADSKTETTEASLRVEVLVAAVKRDVVEFFKQAAEQAGLELVALGWLSDANARLLEACRVTEGSEGVALVSLRPDETGIDVIAQQSLVFSRGVAIKQVSDNIAPPSEQSLAGGKREDTASAAAEVPPSPMPASFAEAVTIEVVRSLHSYGGIKPHIPVAKLFVTGCTGHERVVAEALNGRLNIPCSLLDLAGRLELPEPESLHAPGSISALGLAFGVSDSNGLAFDFLHPRRPAVQRNKRRIKLLAAAALVAATLFALLSARARLVNQRLQIHRQAQVELADAEKKRPIYRQMRQQAATIDEWAKEGQDSLEHYAYLSAILPRSEEIYVTSLSIGGQGSIRFSVQARSGEILAKLDKQLRAAGYEVKPLAITPGDDKFGYDFRSTVELTAPEKMKMDLAKVRAPQRPADDVSSDPAKKAQRKGGGP